MIKVIKFLVKMWLMLAILSVLIAIYMAVFSAYADAGLFLGFAAFSFFLYWLRKKQLERIEKNTGQ